MNDYQAMEAITRALAPADSETQKEWTCISFEVEASELERHDDRYGSWEIRPSNLMASKLIVKWRFLEKFKWKRGDFGQEDRGETYWRPMVCECGYYLDPETFDRIQKELEKCSL